MRLIPHPLDIGEIEGFTAEKDIFQREAFGNRLKNLVQTIEDPLVLLLDSPWGSGKTTFLRMWAGALRNAGHPVIYFDAFARDYIDNAFLAIAGEIISLSDKLKLDQGKLDAFLKTTTKVGGVILRNAAKIGVKAATFGAIDAFELTEELKDIKKDIADGISTATDKAISNRLTRQKEDIATIEAFRSALSKLSQTLSSNLETPDANKSRDPAERPLIFIIDELDRCKPTFALDLLESIKHIFSVRNVHFLLSANLAQLEACVKYSYGNYIDSKTYLQKFYNISVSFPEPNNGKSTIERYIDHLNRQLESTTIANSSTNTAISIIFQVSEARKLSLRAIERIVLTLNIALAMTPRESLTLAPIVAGLCIMKICDPELFQRAKTGELNIMDVDESLKFALWSSKGPQRADWVRAWWIYCLISPLPVLDGINWPDFSTSLARYNFDDPSRVIPWTVESVVERLSL